MFCGNIFTITDLQNHKKNHMKKSQKRFHRVNSALFLSLSNAFEEQKFMLKFLQKIFGVHPVFPNLSVGDSVCMERLRKLLPPCILALNPFNMGCLSFNNL